jgi:hypothetical protein
VETTDIGELRSRLIEYAMSGRRVGIRTRMDDGQDSVVVGYLTGITKGGSVMVQNCGQLVPVRITQVRELREVPEPPGETLEDE